MQKLTQIASGWYNYMTASPEMQKRIEQRLEICDSCTHKEEVDRLTRLVVKTIRNDARNLFRCSLCKCPLASLAAAPGNACKAGKWNQLFKQTI